MAADQGQQGARRPKNKQSTPKGGSGANKQNGKKGGSGAPPPGGGDPGQQPNFQMGRALKTSLGWMAIVLVAFLLASVFSSGATAKQASFTELERYIENGDVESAVITGFNFKGRFRLPLEETSASGQTRVYTEFITVLPYVDSDLVSAWQESDLQFEFKESSPGWFDYIWSAWPILLLVVFWLFIMRRMQGGGMGGPPGGIFNFGKSKAKLITTDKPKVTFDDVAGSHSDHTTEDTGPGFSPRPLAGLYGSEEVERRVNEHPGAVFVPKCIAEFSDNRSHFSRIPRRAVIAGGKGVERQTKIGSTAYC